MGWLSALRKARAAEAERAQQKRDQALGQAAIAGDAKEARRLLAMGASTRAWLPIAGPFCDSATALGLALLHGREDCVDLLLPASDLDKAIRLAGAHRSALMAAAGLSGALFVEKLLPLSDALAKDSQGVDALMAATDNADETAFAALLPHSDPRSQNAIGRTALMNAASWGRARMVGALLRAGADPLAQCGRGRTALMEAAMGLSRECVEILLPVSDASARCAAGLTAAGAAAAGAGPYGARRAETVDLIEGFMALNEKERLTEAARAPRAGARKRARRI